MEETEMQQKAPQEEESEDILGLNMDLGLDSIDFGFDSFDLGF